MPSIPFPGFRKNSPFPLSVLFECSICKRLRRLVPRRPFRGVGGLLADKKAGGNFPRIAPERSVNSLPRLPAFLRPIRWSTAPFDLITALDTPAPPLHRQLPVKKGLTDPLIIDYNLLLGIYRISRFSCWSPGSPNRLARSSGTRGLFLTWRSHCPGRLSSVSSD